MRKQIAPVIAGLGVLAASLMPVTTLAASRHHSGVIGHVFLFACPIVHPGENCYHPYATSITVVTDDGAFVTELATDKTGRFELFLKPGRYVLIPDGADDGTSRQWSRWLSMSGRTISHT